MEQKKERFLNYIKSRYALWILTLILVFMIELLNRGKVQDLTKWVFKEESFFPAFVLTYGIVYGILSLFIALIGRAQIAYWTISTVLVLIAFISGIKWKLIEVPLMPWDVTMTDEAMDLSGYLHEVPIKMVIAILAFVAVGILLFKKLPHVQRKFSWKERGLFLALSIVLLGVITTDKPIAIKKHFGIEYSRTIQDLNYKKNGFLISTILNVDQAIVEKPKGYSEEKIKSLVGSNSKSGKVDPKVNPNVIVILSESLWDMTKMKDVKLSKDPLSFYHSLQKKYSSGEMLSPAYGGWTANVEFEVLTGNTVRFLPQGAIPYNQYINHGVDSLASILGRQGYNTTAISPTHSRFYQANKVYQNFGFSRFISGEFFEDKKKGPYIADEEVAKKIIETTDKSSGSDFIFANTMENHGSYIDKYKDKKTVKVEGQMSAETKDMLENYATGAADADEMLKQLVEHYQKSKEPTIVVFFGDHLPPLGRNYSAYKDAKYIDKDSGPDFLPSASTDYGDQTKGSVKELDFLNKMYRTPLMVWNNYLPEHQDKLDISPNFIGPYVLNLAQKEGTYYTNYLYNLSKKYPMIPPQEYYSQMKIKPEDLADYQMMQYDVMFGEQYGYGKLKDQIATKKMIFGYGDMTIENVELQLSGSEKTIHVTGKNFSGGSEIYLDGKAIETKYQSDGSLIGVVKDEGKVATAKIQVKNGPKGIDLAVSNVYQMKK
ncbi:LTA synthase family protein [Baia soyae]|uniref:Phosphoglycerol transferase MdoB-like AlkP superfamily enzyme n=1 Tax=Baia soyae TaxID=1544746 RepID=A0A4R2S008_9BACL|nr:LTA synthase family protein [Baia soyae]TCP69223.1 phosphoglycerol transferase MdoB-like AlkP superfamily enzyme [Baia soyae]